MEAPLGGGIRYNGPADTLFSLAGQPDQRLSGALGVAADFSGRLSQPSLAGIVRAKNLTYENQTYGTRLTNMALRGRFTGDRLEIEQLDAVAGDGKVSATGYVSLAADSGYPMDVQVQLDQCAPGEERRDRCHRNRHSRFYKTCWPDRICYPAEILLPETRYRSYPPRLGKRCLN